MKGLIEKLPMRGAIDEHRMQCPVEIVPVGDAHGAHSVHRIQHSAGTDGESRGPQHPREVHDIREQVPVLGGDVAGFSHGRTPDWWQAGATPPSSADAPRRRKRGLDLVE